MKIRKNIYLALGILFLLLYLTVLYIYLTDLKLMLDSKSNNFGFFLSSQLWALPPFLFFRASWRLKKKIDRKKRELLENAFTDLPTHQ
ncbi:hypothetical protein [Niastella koreensis]|nr:hypothetical protein [Niastella koreensis]